MRSRGLLLALLPLLAVSVEAVAGERFGAQFEGGIGTKPFSTATKRGFDVGGHVDYRLHIDGGASVSVEAGGDYRYRPPKKAALTSPALAYAGGGGFTSVSGSVRLKARLLSNRMLSPYATAGLRIAHDTRKELLWTYAGGPPFAAPKLGGTSATKALFEVGVGVRLRVAGHHGIVAELQVDDGTSVFPGTVWSFRLGYRVGR